MSKEDVTLSKTHYSIAGHVVLVAALAGVFAFLLFIMQGSFSSWGITKHTAWVVWGCLFSFLLLVPVVIFFWQNHNYKKIQKSYRPESILPDKEKQHAQSASDINFSSVIEEIRHTMKQRIGRFWFRHLRILLIVGTPSEVEQLTPGLTKHNWQENNGTLLLWGGDIRTSLDGAWLKALSKLRYRPLDGMIWVTSACDRLCVADLPLPPLPIPDDNLMKAVATAIRDCFSALGWQLPLYVWSLHPRAGKQEHRAARAVGCLLPAGCRRDALAKQLALLATELITPGIQQICSAPQRNFMLTLADQLLREPQSVSEPLSALLTPYRPLPLAGIIFSQPSCTPEPPVNHDWNSDKRWEVLPAATGLLPAALRPHKTGLPWRKIAAASAAILMMGWSAWMLLSFTSNRIQIRDVQTQAARAAEQHQPLAERLRALLALQKKLSRLQYRATHGVPWYERAGLSRNNALLATVLPRYRDSAQPLLRDAVASHLTAQLNAFVALPPGSPLREKRAKTAYDQLKLLLMIARPERMNAAWFSTTLMQHWPQRTGVTKGDWQGMAPSLLAFWASQLASHPQWRIAVNDGLTSQVRALLIRQMGMRNSESTLYQTMLAQVSHLYTDMRLEDMVGDTDASRVFISGDVVPGIFTRAAWEHAVQPAIDKVVRARRDELDWVLTDGRLEPHQATGPEILKERLTARYFADFSNAWLRFLNSVQLQHADTLSDAIDQLTLLADIRQSPLVALMNTLNMQGRTGQVGGALSDSLVKSAKNLLAGSKAQAIDQSVDISGPLDATFGPVLALMDKNTTSTQNLQAYLTRVTQVRLRLQQVTNATDPQAMTLLLAQNVFQGKTAELTETRDYGSLIAAGLGQEWSGFGQTVFVRPMDQAWQQVLAPAAASLNALWQQAIVKDWNRAFAGRYPFSNSGSEVSLPLLAKYLNAESGRIAEFLQARLGGVLRREGSRWVPDGMSSPGLTINPAFLRAMNTLSHISDVAFTNGEARLHFELRPGSAAGVMQTELNIDGHKLTYVNQLPGWKRFRWPADTDAPGATLSWISTQAGTRQYADMPGAWGFIRLLDNATVTPNAGVSSSFSVKWLAQDGRPLNYTLRTEADEGPLVMLKLRRFRLPETIFSVDER